MPNNDHVYCVILAGGGGTRLWPTSRDKTPKQFLKLTDDKTMMQIAAERGNKIVDWDRIIVVTNQKYSEEVKKQLPEIPDHNIIAEPERKETAMAMLVGALYAQSLDPDAVVFNLASDHVVTDEKEFIRVMHSALEVAVRNKHLISIGITPSSPSSAFGYVRRSELLEEVKSNPVYKVVNFTEKPTVEKAKEFLQTGEYYWNANMYVWSAKALVEAFRKHKPSLLERTEHLASISPADFHASLASLYNGAEKISIDYAISEKADNLVLIPGDFGWDDVGDWKVMYNLSQKDENKNAVVHSERAVHPLVLDSQKNLVYTHGRLVALVGLDDYIVVDSDDILMVVPKSRSQDVKKLVNQLKEENRKEYL